MHTKAAVKPVPDGYHTVVPYLVVRGVPQLLEFLIKAFDAKTVHVSKMPDGSIPHADVLIGDSHLMMGESRDPYPAVQSNLYLYVPNCDDLYNRAIAAGATSIMAPADQFYGDRNAGVKDAWGNSWWIGTHVEDVAPDELKRRQEAWARGEIKH